MVKTDSRLLAETARLPSQRLYFLTLGFFFITAFGFVVQGLLAQHMLLKTVPLVDASKEVRIKVSEFHLWFEEFISGDVSVTEAGAWDYLIQARWYANALLQGDTSERTKYYALEKTSHRQLLKKVLGQLEHLEEIGLARVNKPLDGQIGQAADQQFDHIFRAVIFSTIEFERAIQQEIRSRIVFYRSINMGVGALLVFLFLLVWRAYVLNERIRNRFITRLCSANAQLLDECQQHSTTRTRLHLSRQAFEKSTQAIVITDANNFIQEVNPAFIEMTGFSMEDAIGATPAISKSDRHDAAFYSQMWQAIDANNHWEGEIWDRRKDGSIYPKWLSVDRLLGKDGTIANYIATFYDLTAQKHTEEELDKLLHFDPLTGLPNRRLFYFQLESEIVRAEREKTKVAVITIDLDRFQQINDSYGFVFGDQLIVDVAERLKKAVVECADCVQGDPLLNNRSGILSRLSGDLFITMLSGIHHGEYAFHLLHRVQQILSKPFLVNQQEVFISASLGVGIYPDNADSAHALMLCSERALSKAKVCGGSTCSYYSDEMSLGSARRIQLETQMRHSIEAKEFVLHYQPKLDLESNIITGVEALIRWSTADGLIMPDDFIPLAEDTGLILSIGEWVINKACKDIQQFNETHSTTIGVAINLSAKQFAQENLVGIVRKALVDSGIPAHLVELEITESMLMTDLDFAVAMMEGLCRLGVSLAIDDFGTGYSSLTYLKNFPVSALKIDKSFVKDLESDHQDAEIVAAVCSLGKRMRLDLIGEGVETAAQLDYLRANQCTIAQGFLISRPAPLEDIRALPYALRTD